MIPINPFSALTRTAQFVTEEWNAYFANNATDPASGVVGGWKGILYANLAIIDPVSSWNFFSQENFDPSWLDGGASLTWYLAYAAGMAAPRRVIESHTDRCRSWWSTDVREYADGERSNCIHTALGSYRLERDGKHAQKAILIALVHFAREFRLHRVTGARENGLMGLRRA